MKTHSLPWQSACRFILGIAAATVAATIQAQPSRPFLGIYSHTGGPPSGSTATANFDANPYLAGLTVKVGWNSIQPTNASTFNWTGVGDILTVAGQRGKRVHLAIIPGFTTPSWVYGPPHNVPFLNDVNVSGTVGDAPIPWNPTYVALFDAVIDSFANYLSTHPYKSALTAIEVMGHHYRGEEMHAPNVNTFTAQGFSITYADIYNNWKHWIDRFEQKFPAQELILVMSQTYSGAGTDGSNLSPLLNDISRYFVDTLLPSARAVLQTDQLDGRRNSAGGVTPQRCIFFNNPPYTGANAVPNGHEMVGNFRTQPFRQGRPAMTVFNHKAMLNPYYMQIWSGNITDLWVAKDLLKEWYRYRNSTVAQMQADLTARGLYLATTNYATGSTAPQADDTLDTTPNGTPKTIRLSFDDTAPPAPNSAASFRIIQPPSFGTLGPIAFAGGVATVTYTPTSNNVIDSFRWEATDTAANDFAVTAQRSNFAIATIEVGTVPHDPEFSRDPISSAGLTPPIPPATANAAYSGTIARLASDVDAGTSLTFSKDSGPAWLTIAADGTLSGTPTTGNVGENRWVAKVTDNTGREGFTTLIIRVDSGSGGPVVPPGDPVSPPGAPGRLVNLSARGNVTSAEPLIGGFVIGGTGSRLLLVRAIGPALTNLGVTGALSNPRLRLFREETVVAENDDWQSSADATQIAAVGASVGAFALGAGSRDAAVLVTLPPGAYTAHALTANGVGGEALVELYDASPDSAGRLVNLSCRVRLERDATLIVGFAVAGGGSREVLVRAVGPTLAGFGVGDTLADPRLEVFNGNLSLLRNDDWSRADNVTALAAFAQQAGAFALTAGSRDSAALVALAPGAYTAHIPGNAGGSVLAEIYVP